MRAIENCRESKLAVVLVPTIVKGVNDDQLGEIVRFAAREPIVKGVNIQARDLPRQVPLGPSEHDGEDHDPRRGQGDRSTDGRGGNGLGLLPDPLAAPLLLGGDYRTCRGGGLGPPPEAGQRDGGGRASREPPLRGHEGHPADLERVEREGFIREAEEVPRQDWRGDRGRGNRRRYSQSP